MYLPDRIEDEAQLDDVLTRPSAALVRELGDLPGTLMVVGAGGKMGPTLAARAARAVEQAGSGPEVVAVSRFSRVGVREWLEERGVRTFARDLLEPHALADLPEAAQVVYLVGLKFGTEGAPARTWAANTLPPPAVCRRWPDARVVALSTGNVYPLVPAAGGGSREEDPPAPVGEYGAACLGRERLFEFFSGRNGTPVALLRLNYALDLRYGVLLDLAQRVAAGIPVDLATGHLNCIWQGDANDMVLRSLSLARSPAAVYNLTGVDILSVRELATRLGELLGRPPRFAGAEATTALLSDSSLLRSRLGDPPTPLDRVLLWTAEWVRSGGATLGKPTHFEVRDGRF